MLLACLGVSWNFSFREEEKRILDEILGKSVYDNRIRPSGTNGTGWQLFLWKKFKQKETFSVKVTSSLVLGNFQSRLAY